MIGTDASLDFLLRRGIFVFVVRTIHGIGKGGQKEFHTLLKRKQKEH